MNQFEIEEKADRYAHDPRMAEPAKYLLAFCQIVNSHSDGWAYFRRATAVAEDLQRIVQTGSYTPVEFEYAKHEIERFCKKEQWPFPGDILQQQRDAEDRKRIAVRESSCLIRVDLKDGRDIYFPADHWSVDDVQRALGDKIHNILTVPLDQPHHDVIGRGLAREEMQHRHEQEREAFNISL